MATDAATGVVSACDDAAGAARAGSGLTREQPGAKVCVTG
jgi:hypothetical protein